MLFTNQPSEPENRADQLARLSALLGLEIAPDDLKALSNQLDMMETLEESALADQAPILKMDADWHE